MVGFSVSPIGKFLEDCHGADTPEIMAGIKRTFQQGQSFCHPEIGVFSPIRDSAGAVVAVAVIAYPALTMRDSAVSKRVVRL